MVSRERVAYQVVARSAASPERVWRWLADSASWQEWAGPVVVRSWWEREGTPAPGGVGAVRRLGFGVMSSREEIVEFDPPRHLGYIWLTGVVRDYRADVRLEPDGEGTRIVWHGGFAPRLPGQGPLMRRFFERTVGGFARRLAAQAEREG